MKKVLFVCLGNICRSPMAEGMFLHLLEEKGLENSFEVDSAGTAAYHIGKRPDSRMIDTAASHNVYLPSIARQVKVEDFDYFDHILAMDESNYENLLSIAPQKYKARVELMRNYDVEKSNFSVPDPYYGGQEGFEEVFQILNRSCEQFLKQNDPS